MPKLESLRRATALLAASLSIVLLACGTAGAHDYTAGALKIDHPWSRATATGVKVGGGYLTVRNTGSEADRLVSVDAPFAERAEIHESSVSDGVARMREIEGGVEIPAGATVDFAPGGKHLMFVGLKKALAKGETVKGALTFEKAGRVDVEFTVEAAGAKPGPGAPAEGHMDHSGHKM